MQNKIRGQRKEGGVKSVSLIFSASANHSVKKKLYTHASVCAFTLEYEINAFPLSLENILSYPFKNEC